METIFEKDGRRRSAYRPVEAVALRADGWREVTEPAPAATPPAPVRPRRTAAKVAPEPEPENDDVEGQEPATEEEEDR